MKKREVYLSLGTNLGDRKANIERALMLLDKKMGERRARLSSIKETKSWGFEAPDFLNCAVMYFSDKNAEEILDICKTVEREMGRDEKLEFDADGKRIYHSRIIDVDILEAGDEKIDTERLKVPHPLMGERPFIMESLNEIKNSIK